MAEDGDGKSVLAELQALQAALEAEEEAAGIEQVLNSRRVSSSTTSRVNKVNTTGRSSTTRASGIPTHTPSKTLSPRLQSNTDYNTSQTGSTPEFHKVYGGLTSPDGNSPVAPSRLFTNPLVTIDDDTQIPPTPPILASPEHVPETADRFTRAKLQLQRKQLEEAHDLRGKMEEQLRELSRQLKIVREENTSLTKRLQQAELELRKQSRKSTGDREQDQVAALQQEVASLKKDLQTAERIAKQSDSGSKNKDLQLKRATEQITKLKTQLQEAQRVTPSSVTTSTADSSNESLQARVRALEKQRTELIDGFRKQQRLIDVLKRQKVHLEAARLLAFTEEEFMKTLDWTA